MRLKTTREERDEMRNTGDASTIGIFFGVAIFLGYGIGAFLDRKFPIAPWGTIVGAMFGIAAGFVNLVQVANRISKSEEEAARRKKEEQK